MSENDWDTFTILRKKHKTKEDKTQAKRDGNTTSEKKFQSGGNKQNKDTNIKTLEENTDGGTHKTINKSLSQVISKARIAKGLTQKVLAKNISEKPDIIANYELGKAIPNNQVLGKLERQLGIILRGDPENWGKPKVIKKKK